MLSLPIIQRIESLFWRGHYGVAEQSFDREPMGVNQGLSQPFQQKPGIESGLYQFKLTGQKKWDKMKEDCQTSYILHNWNTEPLVYKPAVFFKKREKGRWKQFRDHQGCRLGFYKPEDICVKRWGQGYPEPRGCNHHPAELWNPTTAPVGLGGRPSNHRGLFLSLKIWWNLP